MLLRKVCSVLCLFLLIGANAPAQDKPKFADDHQKWVDLGVLRIISPEPLEEELGTGPLELYEIRRGIEGLDYKPNYEAKTATVFERAKEVVFRRPIWNLEFSFKTVRLVSVEVPQPAGPPVRKNVWYMLYRVRNLGGHWTPLFTADAGERAKAVSLAPPDVTEGKGDLKETLESSTRTRERADLERFAINEVDQSDLLFSKGLPGADGLRFYPHFVLEAHEFDKEYLDRLVPAALPAIEKIERVGKPIYDSVSISKQKIELTTAEKDNSVWGVAMWEDVDPRIDFFSVYLQGLTNAFKTQDDPKQFKVGDPPAKTRSFVRKTLQMHFWRPGDTINPTSRDFRFGMPKEQNPALQLEVRQKYGYKDPLDFRWIYR
jgi:hypothetical protein